LVAFEGDTMIAIFGGAHSGRDDGILATRAALFIRRDWDKALGRKKRAKRLPLRIGLSTGRAFVGLVGGQSRRDFVAAGDAVRDARALCDGAKPGQLLASGRTLAILAARFDALPLGERLLRRRMRTAVFDIVGEDVDAEAGTTPPKSERPQGRA
jgi:class 3 adenylate cyclase